MDYSRDTSVKLEEAELVECDVNDNFQELIFDIDVKVEKDVETNENGDWCVSIESCGDLLEPLFFKEVAEAQGYTCQFCFNYFSDSSTLVKHNLTHLQVTVVNPTLFQCDCCSAYFTEQRLVKRHILTNNQNVSKTSGLAYKPKASKSIEVTVETRSLIDNPVIKKEEIISNINVIQDNKTNKVKLKDGMTNLLTYKPKTYNTKQKKTKVLTEAKNHQCDVCLKTYSYKHWHSHMRTVHGDGGYFCGICDISFKCERYFLRHMSHKHDKAPLPKGAMKASVKCDQCDATLGSPYALTTHKRNVHSDSTHVCHICNSKLKCKSYLLSHMRRVHYNDGKKHMCECGKGFKSPRYLSVHKKNAHSK